MKTYLRHKEQMQGLEDVAKTVKTVEKIAASSVHFLKGEVARLNLYAAEIEKVLSQLSLFHQEKEHLFLQKKNIGKKALVILTGDKGLVSGLWHDIVNVFLENKGRYQAIIMVGAKGERYLEEENINIVKSFSQVSNTFQKEEIEVMTNYIFDQFGSETFCQVDILYPQFISLAQQQPLFIPFLPFEFAITKKDQTKKKKIVVDKASGLPIFEPSKKRIFDQLLQKYIGVFFYKIIMETKLSELSARTVAMEHAAAKTKELIQRSMLNYLKEQRRIFTQKQLESFVAHQALL